jgi:RNA polymerase sigma factor (sigma-70 family)
MKRNRSPLVGEFDEADGLEEGDRPDPETALIQNFERKVMREAIEGLPFEFREVLIMRELEELSYREIAAIAQIRVGTVMSRLSRARKKLQKAIREQLSCGSIPISVANFSATTNAECKC